MVRHLLSSALILIALVQPALATYATDFALSQNTTFQQQVQMSVFKAANAISNEAATTHPNVDSKRHALAVLVLGNLPTGYTATLNMQFVFAAIETGLTGTPTDPQVDTAVASVWNGIAGVSSRDLVDLQ